MSKIYKYKCKVKWVGNDPRDGCLVGWNMDGEGHPDPEGVSYDEQNPDGPLYGGRTLNELIEIYDLCKPGYRGD